MITHTITFIELSYTLVALIGLIYTYRIFHRSVDDYSWVILNGVNGMRRYSAKTSIFIFLGGILTQVCYVVVGCVAMTQPSIHQTLNWANFVTGFSFMFCSLASSIFAGIIYKRRLNLVEMLEKELAKNQAQGE